MGPCTEGDTCNLRDSMGPCAEGDDCGSHNLCLNYATHSQLTAYHTYHTMYHVTVYVCM